MYQIIVTVLVALFAFVASSAPTADGIDLSAQKLDRATWDVLSWEVAPRPGAPAVILNGTAEQVYAKLKEINPNYDDDWKDIEEPEIGHDTLFEKRTPNDMECWSVYRYGARHDKVQANIEYLRDLKGQPTLDAGPNRCSRVSCSGEAAVYWCNDSKESKTLPSFNNIADAAQIVLDNCQGKYFDGTLEKLQHHSAGELNHWDQWRVGVLWETFYCSD